MKSVLITASTSRQRRARQWITGVVLVASTAPALAVLPGTCGALYSPGQYGPYDYRTNLAGRHLVESAHFTPMVEGLVRGNTVRSPGPDIDYTLRALPNNARALNAMMRLGEKENTDRPQGSRYTVECWFLRGIEFRPEDPLPKMVFAIYLHKNKRTKDAVFQLEQAAIVAGDDSFAHYNVGLVYFDMKMYTESLAQAHVAFALGFERTDLKERLQALGQWKEPPAVAPPQAASSQPDMAASAPLPEPTASTPAN